MPRVGVGRRRVATLALGLALAAVVPAAAAVLDTIFVNGFEAGEMCGWSAVTTACVSESEVGSALTGATLPACAPRTSGSSFPYDYTLCPEQVCADGVTPGCPTTFHVVTAAADFTAPAVALDLTGDDTDLPVYIHDALSGTSATCTLQLRSGTGTSDVPLGVAACFPGYLFGESAGPATTSVTVTMSIAESTPLCQTAATLLPFVQGQILAGIETGVGEVCSTAVAGVTAGRFLCAP